MTKYANTLKDGQYAFYLGDFLLAQNESVGDMIFYFDSHTGHYILTGEESIQYSKEIVCWDDMFIRFRVKDGVITLIAQQGVGDGTE